MGTYNQQYDTWAYPKMCFAHPQIATVVGENDDKPSKIGGSRWG